MTAFIIEFYKTLQPDPAATSTALLSDIALSLRCQRNQTSCPQAWPKLPSDDDFEPTATAWIINFLWFGSLTISLMVSTLALFVKQWVRAYKTDVTGSRHTYVRLRQFKLNGIREWWMPVIIAALPQFLFAALVMFLIGLIFLLQSLDNTAFWNCLAITASLLVFIVVAPILPLFYPNCPYQDAGFRAYRWFRAFLRGWIYGTTHNHHRPSIDLHTQYLHDRLDGDALEWLLMYSNDQKVIELALKGTAGLSAHQVNFKYIRFKGVARMLLKRLQTFCQNLPALTIDIKDISSYLQGLYIILQQGNPLSDVWDRMSLLGIEDEFKEILEKLSLVPESNPWEESGTSGLFRMKSIRDCNWLLDDTFENCIVMSDSTLELAMTRLYALHSRSSHIESDLEDHATIRLMCKYLCFKLRGRPLHRYSKDRLVQLAVLILHMLSFGRSKWNRSQHSALDSLPYQELLPEAFIKVLSHYNHFGLKETAAKQLWELMQNYLEPHMKSMKKAYGTLSTAECGNFFATLEAFHDEEEDPATWQRLVSFLSLPLHALSPPPPAASQLAVRYLTHCNLDSSHDAYILLHQLTRYPDHCAYFLRSPAWISLVRQSRTLDLAMHLVRKTLHRLVTVHGPWSGIFEDIAAERICANLASYLETLEITTPEHSIRQLIIVEWVIVLDGLSWRYKNEIAESGIHGLLASLSGELGYAKDSFVQNMLTQLNKSLMRA